MDTHISDKLSASTRITAFVDTSVFGAYLAGRDAASRLFEDGHPDQVRFAVDPVVLREVLSLPQIRESPELLETLADRLNFEVLPLDLDRSEQLLQRAKALRDIVHSSSIMVAASAENCDYLITYDRGIKELIEGDKPRVVTPEEFTSLIASA